MLRTSLAVVVLVTSLASGAASADRLPVHGDVGLGFGQTLFFGSTRPALRSAYGGAFDPGIGNNLLMGFSLAPTSWRGLAVGSRIKGTFGSSVTGEGDASYVFNYYNLALTLTYYPLTRTYGRGPFARASVGFGQMTTKRIVEATDGYQHQYAIGASLMGAVGYTQPVGVVRLSLEVELEYASRGGTVDGVGATTFESGQLGGNFVVTF